MFKLEMADITLEGANTSFQVHYRVDPQVYADTFNAVQLVTPLGLAVAVLIGKPLVFGWLLTRHGEPKSLSKEIGLRLGQMSEFSLLVAALAALNGIISEQATALITTTTLLTLVASSHLIVSRVPNPIATDPKLRRD